MLQGAIAGAGGLVTAWLPAEPAQATHLTASSSTAGALVTPDPLKPRIEKSGLVVGVADFSTPPRTSSGRPYANLNFLYHAGDGSGWLFANDTRGKIWRINRSTGAATIFLDLKAVRGSALLESGQQRGLRSFAFHPDFARSGRPGYRKLYTISTETTGSRPSGVPLFGGSFTTTFHDVLAEWSIDTSSPPRVAPGSRREVLRIAEWKNDHNADQLMFDPNAAVGSANYGKLFIGTGDAGNNPANPDPYNLAQNPKSALGKILRIDPLRRSDGKPYGVPSDNPFVGKSTHLPEIWALGLRHPQNICFDRGGTLKMIITDIGQAQIEEVNLGIRGANYGWPLREGTFVTNRYDETKLYAPPTNESTLGYTAPVAHYDHSEGKAICGGFVYRGSRISALRGHYLCGDLVNGRIFHVPASSLVNGSQATLKELTLRRNGSTTTLLALVGGSNGRVDLRFGQDEAGEIYLLTKQDGKIRRLVAP